MNKLPLRSFVTKRNFNTKRASSYEFWSIWIIMTNMTWITSFVSVITLFSENIYSLHLSALVSTCMNSLRTIIFVVFPRAWYVGLLYKSSKLLNIRKITKLFIVIWNQKIFYSNNRTKVASRSLIMVVLVSLDRGSIRIFSQDFIEHQRSFWAYHSRWL